MAAAVRIIRARVPLGSSSDRFSRVYTWCANSATTVKKNSWSRCLRVISGAVSGAAMCSGAVLYFLDSSVKAMGLEMTPPSYPWKFRGLFASHDHATLRRGWHVYKTICYTCHSLQYLRFLDLVNVSHTEDEVKAIAAEFEVQDGPDQEGNYYMRPAKLSDRLPNPYPNEEAARAANNGAYPPDLTYIVEARRNGLNYLFAYLTGWFDPPAGVTQSDGQYFNIYFPGGATSMAQMIQDGVIDYEDGTPATQSQMAKDVAEFLCWTSSQDHDTRKVMMIKGIGIFAILLACTAHYHRHKSSYQRSRQIAYVPKRNF